jgi:hypothetical protein
MKKLADRLQKTIKAEKLIRSKDQNFRKLENYLIEIEKLGYSHKQEYTIPLVDTIGRTTYSTLNKSTSLPVR